MSEDEFWNLVDGLSPRRAKEELAGRLLLLEPAEIADFQSHFRRANIRAYGRLLWAAAYIIQGGGCSDDAFTDFRSGLISRGRRVFEDALRDPDSLVVVASDDPDGFIANEEFGYVAVEVYRKKTGTQMPYDEIPYPSTPLGESWKFSDEQLCAMKLPKLWAKFGN